MRRGKPQAEPPAGYYVVTIRFPVDSDEEKRALAKRLKVAAAQDGKSINEFCRDAINAWLDASVESATVPAS